MKMAKTGMKYRNQSSHLGNGYLQAIVIIKEHVKIPASTPPRSHLKGQDGAGQQADRVANTGGLL